MSLTGAESYFEDFTPGDVYEHSRGRTVTEMDNVLITHLTMNTASPHFNLHMMQGFMGGEFPERLVMGGYTIGLVVGLTSEDISENAVADLGYTNIRLKAPVFHGDTLYAESEILRLEESPVRPDCGVVHYRFRGRNQQGVEVVEGERTILVKKRAFWTEQ